MEPEADYYYDRLGIESNATKKKIKKSGKLAFKRYAEKDRDLFLRVRQARETLEENHLRDTYDTFCNALGSERGTQAFELWEAQGSQQNKIEHVIEKTKEEPEDAESPEVSNTSLWEKIEIDDPKIEWSNRDFPESIHVSLWEKMGKRLYLNNFDPKHDVYLDLDTGTFYTNTYDSVPDLNYRIIRDGKKLFINGDAGELKIDLLGKSTKEKRLSDVLNIKNPEVSWISSGNKDFVNVEHWKKHGKNRLYINNFNGYESIYLDLYSGAFKINDGPILSNTYYEIEKSGQILHFDFEGKKIKIKLQGQRQKEKERKKQKQKQRQKEKERKKQKQKQRQKEKERKKQKQPPIPAGKPSSRWRNVIALASVGWVLVFIEFLVMPEWLRYLTLVTIWLGLPPAIYLDMRTLADYTEWPRFGWLYIVSSLVWLVGFTGPIYLWRRRSALRSQ